MERAERRNDGEHVIDITSSSVVSSTTTAATAANGGISRNALVGSRGQSSPLNSGYWIFMEWVMIMSQIIAAFVVLGMSRDERPEPPLFTWVIGYASGCFAILPLLLWRFCNGNHDPSQPRETSVLLYARLKVVFEYYKMGLDCFFAVWFVVGNVWIFGGHSSFSDAPNLYRLCIVFLTFSCIGYAMPFILCTTICCCLPCIISLMGLREESTPNRGATTESINSLPTYKFKVKKKNLTNDQKTDLGAGEGGGIVAAGTEKEQIISGEDAVCCICLGKYANNDELRELTCSHFFHKICVDKWLKINASCPLCKSQVGESNIISQTEVTVSNASV